MLESEIERRFVEAIRDRGGLSFKITPTVKGLPDRLVIVPGGRLFLVELKRVGGRVSPAQEAVHRKLLARGVRVRVLYGWEDCRAWIERKFPDADD